MPKMKCLVIMPFKGFDPVFKTVRETITTEISDQPFDCFWLKEIQAAGKINDHILDSIERSAICIADVTNNNPNVMWETGYAMALGKPTLLIGQDLEALPFDLKDHHVLQYSPDKLDNLRQPLAESIRQTLARYDVKPKSYVEARRPDIAPVIAVTGTMKADKARVRRRVEILASSVII